MYALVAKCLCVLSYGKICQKCYNFAKLWALFISTWHSSCCSTTDVALEIFLQECTVYIDI